MGRKSKIEWVSVEVMKGLVWDKPTTDIASMLEVSDKAIERYCKRHNIDKPTRGYWTKDKYEKRLKNN
jgi:mannose/cellobiose epimerase-like protein (N-acyl-D-glucosamine 2-epimerase family)